MILAISRVNQGMGVRPSRATSRTSILLLLTLVSSVAPVYAEPTYYDDVAPILAHRCVQCHQPGSAAPMALMTYDQVRPWATRIRELVAAREMPPFGAEAAPGFFANDARLTEDELAAIVNWVNNGCPKGAPPQDTQAHTPPPAWPHGEPDLVISTYTPDSIAANNTDDWRFIFFDYSAPGERWIRGLRVMPEQENLVHHVNIFLMDPAYQVPPEKKIRGNAHVRESKLLALWAPGRPPLWCPDNIAVRLPAHSHFGANIHYAPSDIAASHTLRLGIYFAQGPVQHELELRVAQVRKDWIAVPPNEARYRVSETQLFSKEDVLIYAFAGHMHFRGKAVSIEFLYPDGTAASPFGIPRFNFYWQQKYELAQPMLVSGGTQITVTGTYDNSANNPYNPDATALVKGGVKTEDEMMEVYFDVVAPGKHVNIDVVDGVPVSAAATSGGI